MRRGLVFLVPLLFVGLTGTSEARTPPTGVVFAYDIYTGGYGAVAVQPDSTGLSRTCPGDPTHAASPRRFLRGEGSALVWSWDEYPRCDSKPLHNEPPDVLVGVARWSPSGARVAFVVTWTETAPDGSAVQRYGIKVGQVLAAADVMALVNVRLAVELPAGVGFNWAPDNVRITFASAGDIHVANLDDEDLGSLNVTNSRDSEHYPSFSPDGKRIAFSKTVIARGGWRSDIFTMEAEGGTPHTRVTDKWNTASESNVQPTWSPNGDHLGFACMTNLMLAIVHVCRIDKDGTTKAVDLTPKVKAYFSITGWRS